MHTTILAAFVCKILEEYRDYSKWSRSDPVFWCGRWSTNVAWYGM